MLIFDRLNDDVSHNKVTNNISELQKSIIFVPSKK